MNSLKQLLSLALALSATLSTATLIACDDTETTNNAGAEVNAGVTAGVTAGMTAGVTAGVTAGMTAGVTAGMTAGMTAGVTAGVTAGMTAGMTAGAELPPPAPPVIPMVAPVDCTAQPCAVSVMQARSGDVVAADTLVSLGGVISATRTNADGEISHIVVQADEGGPLSGIWVYVNDAQLELPALAEGQRVELTALTADRFGQRQLQKIEAFTVLGQEVAPQPLTLNPADIATMGEYGAFLEGVLVAVEGVEVLEINPTPGTADADPNNEFVVTGGLRVNDYLTEFPSPVALPAVGDRFSRIVGVLRFGNDDYKIEPRYAADLTR